MSEKETRTHATKSTHHHRRLLDAYSVQGAVLSEEREAQRF